MQILYNSVNFNDGINYIVEDIAHEVTPKPELNLQKLARSNESILLRKGYGTKRIEMTLTVVDTSIELLDARLDTVKQAIEAVAKNLDIVQYNSETRRYVCSGFIDSVSRKPKTCTMKIHFDAYIPFGKGLTENTAQVNATDTAPSPTLVRTILGTYSPLTRILVYFFAVPSSASGSISIKNVETGETITVQREDWASGDILIINSETRVVTKNGTEVQYLGMIPDWFVGVNTLQYIDTFTSRTNSIQFKYTKRFL